MLGTSRLGIFVDPNDASDVITLNAGSRARHGVSRHVIEVVRRRVRRRFQRHSVRACRGFTSVRTHSSCPPRRDRRGGSAGTVPPSTAIESSPVRGGLISYASSLTDFYRRFSAFVDKKFSKGRMRAACHRTGREIRLST